MTDRGYTRRIETFGRHSSEVEPVLCLLPSRSKLQYLCGPQSIHKPDSFSKPSDPKLLNTTEIPSLGSTIRSANLNSNVLQQGQRVYLSSKPQISLLHFTSHERQSANETSSAASSQALPPQPTQCLSSSRHLLAKRTRIEQSPSSSGDLVAEENLKRQKVDSCYASSCELQKCSAEEQVCSFELGEPSDGVGVISNDTKEILLRMFENRLRVQKQLHIKE